MKDFYIVTETDGDVITVTPEASKKNRNGAGGGKPQCRLTVLNSRRLSVVPGDKVIIGISEKAKAAQGIVSLLFPVLCTAAGRFLASPFAHLVKKAPSENLEVLCMSVCFTAACIIVFICTRRDPIILKPELIEVCRKIPQQ